MHHWGLRLQRCGVDSMVLATAITDLVSEYKNIIEYTGIQSWDSASWNFCLNAAAYHLMWFWRQRSTQLERVGTWNCRHSRQASAASTVPALSTPSIPSVPSVPTAPATPPSYAAAFVCHAAPAAPAAPAASSLAAPGSQERIHAAENLDNLVSLNHIWIKLMFQNDP